MENVVSLRALATAVISALLLFCHQLSAQSYDSVRIMSYNVLNYPGNSSGTRNPEFRKILRHVNPDILVVQEMVSATGLAEFLNSVLNSEQPGVYSAAPFIDGPDTDNGLYYKPARFMFLDQVVLHTQLRNINGYRLRPVGIGADTLDIRIYSMHLKASQGYEAQRFAEADTLRNHLNALPDGLFLIGAGDLNIYTSNEPAYQELIGSQTDNSGRLYDPINMPGSWNNNAAYAAVHTQSTRTGSIGDGGATGGLDDRFDFLLPSYAFQAGTRWRYAAGTYIAIGNDGNHFDQSINNGINTAVPDSIADALYLASDHLPVCMYIVRPLPPPPVLIVGVPNGGESWYAGNTYEISWSSQHVAGTVSLHLNREYPAGAWETLVTGQVNNDTYPWLVTLPVTENARVRIVADGQPTVEDVSDESFAINMPAITITTPDGGDAWFIGQQATVAWTSAGAGSSVRIELNRNYPAGDWEILAPVTANDGEETWQVSGNATNQARIRILGVSNALAGDTSANFQIRTPSPPVIAHDPHGDATEGLVTFTAQVTDDAAGTTTMLFWRHTESASFDSSVMTSTGYGSDEVAASVQLSYGRYTYFLRATDSYGLCSSTDTCEFIVDRMCDLAIQYDDGSGESFQWSAHDGYSWAVRFTPPQTPFVLCSAEIGVAAFRPDSSHERIVVRVIAADGIGGLPGTVLRELVRGSVGNEVGGLASNTDYFARVFLWGETTSPLVFEEDFYIAVSNSAGGTEAFALDSSSVTVERSYVWDPCDETWIAETSAHPSARRGNRMIRVSGWRNVPAQVVIQRSGSDARLSWVRTGAPFYRVYKSSTSDGNFIFYAGTTTDTSLVIPDAFQVDLRAFFRVHSSSSP